MVHNGILSAAHRDKEILSAKIASSVVNKWLKYVFVGLPHVRRTGNLHRTLGNTVGFAEAAIHLGTWECGKTFRFAPLFSLSSQRFDICKTTAAFWHRKCSAISVSDRRSQSGAAVRCAEALHLRRWLRY